VEMLMNIRVVPYNGKWAIVEDGEKKLRIVHNSKSDALLEAKKLARTYNSELTFQDNDGLVHDIYL
jgi:hypothetical protein